jgi:hypothetical protein
MQICLILEGIALTQPKEEVKQEESKKAPKHVRDLLHYPGLMNFLLNYLKDMKNDTVQILISQETMTLIESFKVGLNELHKINEEQLKQLKESLVNEPGHEIYETLRDEPQEGFSFDILRDLLHAIVDVLSKKLPQDVNFNPQKLEQLTHKIKLIPIPKTVIVHTGVKTITRTNTKGNQSFEEVHQEKNTGEKAVVRIRIPRKKADEGAED